MARGSFARNSSVKADDVGGGFGVAVQIAFAEGFCQEFYLIFFYYFVFTAAKVKVVGFCIIIKCFEKVCRLYFERAADCHKPWDCTAVVVKVGAGLGQFKGLLLVLWRELICFDNVVGRGGFKCKSQLLCTVIKVGPGQYGKTEDFQVVGIEAGRKVYSLTEGCKGLAGQSVN